MENQTLFEQLMNQLVQDGRVEDVNVNEAYQQKLAMDSQMEEFEIQKQLKAAVSQNDLATIVLTA